MIKIFTVKEEIIKARKDVSSTKSVGMVPTMGNLHQGHLSLIEASLASNDITVVSIFVNPTQFGPKEDFKTYPRTLDQDIEQIAALKPKSNVLLFAPISPAEIYGPVHSTTVSVGQQWTKMLCGKSRPTHFDGVTTIVLKLINICQPHRLYMGQKDLQQFLIVKKMCRELDVPIEVIPMPIIRDHDGLALSSRNQYLSENERRDQALVLPRTLMNLEKILIKAGVDTVLEECKKITLNDKSWDYLDVINAEDLSPPAPTDQKLAIVGAYQVGKTRLIDNRLVEFNAR